MRLRGEYDVFTDEDRIKLIADLVEEGSKDPEIRELTLNILSKYGVREKDQLGEIRAVFDWVKKNIQYRGDVFCRDSYHTAKRILKLGAGDCFPLRQKIIVRNKETDKYELIELGDLRNSFSKYEALSYNFIKKEWEFKDILNWIDKGIREVVEVSLKNGHKFKATPDHRLFTLEGQCYETAGIFERRISDIDTTRTWKRRLLTAHKIPSLGMSFDPAKLWIYGVYIAEGWGGKYKACIAKDYKDEKEKICNILDLIGVDYSISKREVHGYLSILDGDFRDELKEFCGTKAINKRFPDFVFSLSENLIEILLDGYSMDAYIPIEGTTWYGKVRRIYGTISDMLAEQLVFLHLILGRALYVQYQVNHQGAGKHPIWRLYDRIHKDRTRMKREVIPGLSCVPIKFISHGGREQVCDITVADNHNFVLNNGLIVHNCDDFSILIGSMLASIGYQVGVRIISSRKDRPYHHIYPIVRVKKRGMLAGDYSSSDIWLALDGTNKSYRVGDEPRWAKKKDFIFVCGD